MRSDIVGETKYPNCPDPAYTDSDLESIVAIAERLMLFGARNIFDFRASMNEALRNDYFTSIDEPPEYLPTKSEGFGRAFLDWVHSVAKARVNRRATGNPEDVMRRDLAVGEELETIAMRTISRHGGKGGDPRIAFAAMEFVMRVQDKRHKLMGLDQTSLILANDPSATVAGRVLNSLLQGQGATQGRKAWMLKQTVKPEAFAAMGAEDQALALLRARDTDEKTDDQPDEGQADTSPSGDVERTADGDEMEPAAEDPGLGVA